MSLAAPRATARADWPAALRGGVVAASLDLAYVFSFYGVQGVPPQRILQSIASGLLGREAYAGGVASAALGAVAHYAILIVVAGLCLAARPHIGLMRRRPYLAGVVVGLAIWLVMNGVVLPLSAAPPFHPKPLAVACNFAVHLLLLGPAITLSLARGLRRRAQSPRPPRTSS